MPLSAPDQRTVGYPRSLRRVTARVPSAFPLKEARRSAPTPRVASRRSVQPFGNSREHLIHGNNQQVRVPPPAAVAVQRRSRAGSRASAWWSRSSSMFSLAASSAPPSTACGSRFALAKTFHTNPISAVIGALGGGGGSAIDQSAPAACSASTSCSTATAASQHSGGDLDRLDHGRVDPADRQPRAPGRGDLDPSRLVRAHPAQERALHRAADQLRLRRRYPR